MHYYEHHIGDFMRDTAHLTVIEECFYRRAIDLYYLNEKPLPKETSQVMRRLRAKTSEEIEAVQNVLSDFFTEDEDGFHHRRCDEEIAHYKSKGEKSRENGKKGGRPPKNKTKDEPNNNLDKTSQVILGSENNNLNLTKNNLNQEPLTNNQEPLTNNNNNNSASAIFEIYSDWIPLEPSFSELLADMEIPLSKHTPKTLKDYILHCRAKDPDKQNTQGQWQLFYAKWLQRERDLVPKELNQPQSTKKTSERHVLGVPISRINAEARPGETEEDCAKRLKNPVGSGESSMNVKLADDRPMFEIYAEKEALRKMAAQAS